MRVARAVAYITIIIIYKVAGTAIGLVGNLCLFRHVKVAVLCVSEMCGRFRFMFVEAYAFGRC